MPYPKHEPASIEDMEKRMKGENTLCNTIREMYHITNDEEIRMKCRIAFSMGKAMCERLGFYKEKYGIYQSEFKDGI